MREGADERLLAQVGAESLSRLAGSCVGLVGAGTVGGSFSAHAAMLGIGQIIVDAGRIEAPNLGAQAFPDASVGDGKARIRGWQAKLLNSDCRVEPLEARVEDLGLARLAGADLLVSALDSRRSRLWVNEVSRRFEIPMLDLAVGNAEQGLLASVALYDPRVAGSACFACRMSTADLAAVSREGRPPGCASWRDASLPETPQTLASSSLAAITAGYGMLWAIEVLCGRAEELSGRMLIVKAHPPRLQLVTLEASPSCVHDHGSYLPLREADDDTLGDVLEAATADLRGLPDALVFPGRTLVLGLRCERCGSERGLVRLAQAFADEEVQCDCDPSAEMVPFRLTERLSVEDALPLSELGWEELGIPEADVVRAVRGECAAHYKVHRAHGGVPITKHAKECQT
jgi:molybdopterin/thiamine biosynthesis adenylyltransferase